MKKNYFLSFLLALSFLWTNAQILVSGAGESNANGTYEWNGTRYENSDGYYFQRGGSFWYIRNTSATARYYASDPSGTAQPTDVNWNAYSGAAPAPTVARVIPPYPRSGSGTEGDPYQISSLSELEFLSDESSYWDKHFIQTVDINAAATEDWNSSDGFSPIGNSTTKFTGTYSGLGYTIDSLFVTSSGSNKGMFGYCNGAEIKNLNLFDVTLTVDERNVGILAGRVEASTIIDSVNTSGTINSSWSGGTWASPGGIVGRLDASTLSNSSADVSITSLAGTTGGLVGYTSSSSTVTKCYSTGTINQNGIYHGAGGIVGSTDGTANNINNCYSGINITGINWTTTDDSFDGLGGLIGRVKGSLVTVDNCYSFGSVSSNMATTTRISGLIGVNENADDSNITNCYWDTETSGQASSDGGTGKTTTEMKTEATFASWDFDATWSIRSLDSISYPYLQAAVQNPAPGLEITTYDGGDGTEGDPYQIASLNQLYKLSNDDANWDKYFIQTANINASATSGWNSNEGFSPIGNSSTNFTGTYNGQGYSIDSLTIDRPATSSVGMFGQTANGAVIKKLNLVDVDITGSHEVGALVGTPLNSGTTTIDSVTVTGSITSARTGANAADLGGLVGYSRATTITNSSVDATITGEGRNIGGIAGDASASTSISNCYVNGSITATGTQGNIGGIAGLYRGSGIEECYSTASVTAGTVSTSVGVGGLVGQLRAGFTVNNSYASGAVDHTSGATLGGLIGVNTNADDSNVTNSYWDTETSGQASSDGGTGKSSNQMKVEATFNNWDFASTWNIRTTDSVSYPYLRDVEPSVKPGIEVATYTWVGIDTAWSNTDNWLTGSVPGSGDDVTIEATDNDPVISNAPASPAETNNLTIDAGATLTIDAAKSLTVNSDLTNNGTLTLESGATIITDGTVGGSGSNTVQQDLAGSSRNYYIGSPVSGATGVVFDNGNESKFYHNATEQRYYTLADGDALNAVQGYVYRSADAQTVEFTGALNTGALSNNSLPRVGETNAFRGYNLVANPYPSFIDWKAVTKTNLEPTMWFRTHDGDNNVFATFNATGDLASPASVNGQAVNEFIAPMQGFWVRVDADGNTGGIAFDNTMRSHQTGVLRAPQQQDIFRFTVNKENQSDEAVINFNYNAQEGIETYDSRKMYSNTQAQIATVVNGEDLVINSLPNYYNASVPTKVTFTEAGLYTLKATQQSGELQGVQVVLEDLLSNEKVSFNAGESYSFKGNEEDANRFVIHFGDIPLSTSNVSANAPIVFANNKQITVKIAEVNNAQATIYNVSGQVVQTANVSNTLTQINTNLPSGVYVVEINNGGTLTREKVVIQ